MQALTVNDAITLLTKLSQSGQGEHPLAIRYEQGLRSVGSLPSTSLTGISVGFDWDAGKVFLQTKDPLGLSNDALLKLGKRTDDLSAQVYQLKKSIKNYSPVKANAVVSAAAKHEAKFKIVNSMCLTMRHDYGINKIKEADIVNPLNNSCGMTSRERLALHGEMTQLYEHHVEPHITAMQVILDGISQESSWLELSTIAHLAIQFYKATLITEARARSDAFFDLEESIARTSLRNAIKKLMPQVGDSDVK